MLENFPHFFFGGGGDFSGRFDISGSLIPRLVPEISLCDAFCDGRGEQQQERRAGILVGRSFFDWPTYMTYEPNVRDHPPLTTHSPRTKNSKEGLQKEKFGHRKKSKCSRFIFLKHIFKLWDHIEEAHPNEFDSWSA